MLRVGFDASLENTHDADHSGQTVTLWDRVSVSHCRAPPQRQRAFPVWWADSPAGEQFRVCTTAQTENGSTSTIRLQGVGQLLSRHTCCSSSSAPLSLRRRSCASSAYGCLGSGILHISVR